MRGGLAAPDSLLPRRVYPRFVQDGTMTQTDADREIATMSAIADDYRQKLQPQMF